MMRRLIHALARLGAAFAVIAIAVVPIVTVLRIAGNPFDPAAFERLADRRVDDTTIVKLLTIGFLVVWAWVVGPAIRQAHISLNTRRPTRRTRPVGGRLIEAPADAAGPRSLLARLVRFALTSTLITTVTTTSTLAFASPSEQAPPMTEPAPAVVVDQSTDSQRPFAGRPSVDEHIAGRRDTPYAIAAQRFPDRVDEAREEIVALNHGRPTPDGHMWRGGSFPEGMRVLLPVQASQDDELSNASAHPTADEIEWPTHLPAETVVVDPGDNVWNLTKARLDTVDGPESSPSDSDIAKLVDEVIGSNTFASGNPNLIYPGETIDFPSIGTPSANGDQPQSGADEPPPPPESAPSTTVQDRAEPEVTTPTPVVSEELTEDEPADAATTSAPAIAVPRENSRASVPPPSTVSQPVDQTRTDGETEVDAGESESSLDGVTGAVVLASALAVAMTWERRRRRARGLRSGNQDVADIELAVVAASDMPFVRWAAQELAAMARSLDPVEHQAVPLAVELEETEGIEVLWDQPVPDAPHPWEATDGGWSWRTLYDPDEPTPVSDWPTPLPGLVTIGTRRDRQLLIDLEQVGTLSISGPGDRVDGLLRSMILELAVGDDLSNAEVLSVGADGVVGAHGHRVEQVDLTGATAALKRVSVTAAGLIGNGQTLFQQRLGPDPAIADNVTVVFIGPDVDNTAKEHVVSMVSAGRGMAAVIVGEGLDAAASIVVDENGSAALAGIADQAINFIASYVPLDSSATVERVLNPPPPEAPSTGTPTFKEPADEVLADGAATVNPVEDAAAESEWEAEGPSAAEAELLGADDEPSIPEPAVLIRLFGPPRVEGNPEIRGVSLRLLAYLACQSEPVSLSRIRHVVWGGAARDRKTVSNKLSQLRSILGTTEDGDSLISLATADGVSVHDSVVTDIRIFDELVLRSEHLSSNAAIDTLRDALALIDGEPFQEAGYEWADLETRLHERIVDAAARLFELACEAGDLATARDALVRGLQGVPGHEKLYRLRMQLEHRCVGPTAVHGVFNDLTHQLDALDCEPSDETMDMYRQLTERRTAS